MHPIKQDQHYKSNRGRIYRVKFCDNEVVLLEENENHRLEKRSYFEECIREGFFNLQEDMEVVQNVENGDEEVPFEDIDWVGEVGASSLRSKGLRTREDIMRVSDERILDCDGIGEKGLNNIREWTEE